MDHREQTDKTNQARRRAELQAAVDQGEAFKRLSTHGDWELFRMWLEKGRLDYERAVHAPGNRENGVALARHLEGYDALNNLITNFDRVIANIPENRRKLEETD